jgi:integrase
LQQVLKQPLTDLLLRKLKCEDRTEVWDAKLPGFGVRVSSAGTKSFVLLYRFRGRPQRLTLGRYPVLGLGEAREMAKEALNQVTRGIDPRQGKEISSQSRLFGDVADEFVRVHCAQRNRASTRKETARILQRDFVGHWRRRDVRDITRTDVLEVLDAIVERGSPSGANHALAAIRKCFNWCLERGLIETSPCMMIKSPAKAKARDRVLSDLDLVAIWKAGESIGYPAGIMLQLLVLTAQRRNEVASMRWQDLDLEAGLWTIPAEISKNGKPHLVPLSRMAMTRLALVPRLHEVFVFPARGRSETTFSGFSKLKSKTMQLSQVDGWTLHDLRRSAATLLARLGVAPHVVERVLNHMSGSFGGVAGVYNRFQYVPEMRDGLERLAGHIEGHLRS